MRDVELFRDGVLLFRESGALPAAALDELADLLDLHRILEVGLRHDDVLDQPQRLPLGQDLLLEPVGESRVLPNQPRKACGARWGRCPASINCRWTRR